MSKEIINEKSKESTLCEDFFTLTGGAIGSYSALRYHTPMIDLLALLSEDPKLVILCGLADIGITVAGGVLGGLTGKYIGRGVDKVGQKLEKIGNCIDERICASQGQQL